MAVPFSFTFRGKELLLAEPHAVDSKPLTRTLRNTVAEAVQGTRILETNPESPGGVHQLDFVCETRSDTRALEDFFDARQGSFDGFWVPTWQWEFEIAPYDAVIAGKDPFWIRRCDYSATLFPLGEPYRYALLLYADKYEVRHALDVDADNPVGSGYEMLNLPVVATNAAGFGISRPYTENKGVRPLWLRYVRLADDEVSVQELGTESSLVTVQVVELPKETP